MAAKREVEVEASNDLETRLKCARDIVRILVDYILQGGAHENNSSAFVERAIALYHDVQAASNATQSLTEQLLDLSWSLVTRLRSEPTDQQHALRERFAKEKCHPLLHNGTEGEMLFFTLRYVHLVKKVRRSSIVSDNWPDDIDELARYLLHATRTGADSDPTRLARDVFCVFGEGISNVDPNVDNQGVDPKQIDGFARARALWLGIDESDKTGT